MREKRKKKKNLIMITFFWNDRMTYVTQLRELNGTKRKGNVCSSVRVKVVATEKLAGVSNEAEKSRARQ